MPVDCSSYILKYPQISQNCKQLILCAMSFLDEEWNFYLDKVIKQTFIGQVYLKERECDYLYDLDKSVLLVNL